MAYSIGVCLIVIFVVIGFVYAFYLFLYQCDIIDEKYEKFILEEKKKKCKIDYAKDTSVNKPTHEEMMNYVAKCRLEALRKMKEEYRQKQDENEYCHSFNKKM